MILPTKHLPPNQCLLGLGALIVSKLRAPKTVSALWNDVKEIPEIGTFERFTLTLDLLYLIDAVRLENGFLSRLPGND